MFYKKFVLNLKVFLTKPAILMKMTSWQLFFCELLHKHLKFSIKNFFFKYEQIRRKTGDLFTFTKEVLNRQLLFFLQWIFEISQDKLYRHLKITAFISLQYYYLSKGLEDWSSSTKYLPNHQTFVSVKRVASSQK